MVLATDPFASGMINLPASLLTDHIDNVIYMIYYSREAQGV